MHSGGLTAPFNGSSSRAPILDRLMPDVAIKYWLCLPCNARFGDPLKVPRLRCRLSIAAAAWVR